MKKKVSMGQQQSRDNLVEGVIETPTRMTQEQADLPKRNRDLEKKNEALQDKLDEIADIVECNDPDCSPEEHLQDIASIVAKGDGDKGESRAALPMSARLR